MGRVILHIGTHKTATTSIQKFFDANRDELAARGVFYPGYDLIGQRSHYAHLGIANALSEPHNDFSAADARAFFAAVRGRVPDYDITFLSAEPIYRHVQDYGVEASDLARDAYWPARQAYIEMMREVVGPAEVAVVFRRQADYAQSLYQEHVKTTRYNRNFRSHLEEYWFHYAFLGQAQAWSAVFPDFKAITFDRLLAERDAVGTFCDLMDIPIEGLNRPPRANEGLPVDLVALKRSLHRTDIGKDRLRRAIEKLERVLPEEMHAWFKTRSFFQSREDRQTFQAQFDDDNEALHPFLLDAPDDAPVFPPIGEEKLDYGDRIKPPVLYEMLRLGLSANVAD